MNTRIIKLLLKVCPNSIYQPNNCDWLPTHSLCEGRMDDEVEVEILKLLLEAHPDSARLQSNGDGELPLHLAAGCIPTKHLPFVSCSSMPIQKQ